MRSTPKPAQRVLLLSGLAAALSPPGVVVQAATANQQDVPTSTAGAAISGISDVRYAVTFDSSTAQSGEIHVDMSFTSNGAGPVELSLPAWTPGSYELDNFARYVHNFDVTSDGEPVRWDKSDYDTWRVHPGGARTVTVSFDYRADSLDTGMAWSTHDFAYFNGTNLFLYPEGSGYDFSAKVAIHTELEWRVATGMKPGEAPGEYVAADYHELVDMPTFIGRFDLDSMLVNGRWYRLATYPPEAMSGDARATLWDQIRRMMLPMEMVFGETPWETYTILMVFDRNYPGASALEHANSHLGVYTAHAIGNPLLASVLAHEIFHAWNVKRLRPAELVPYEYGRPQPTTLLWISEGITDYYADLALVRGGIAPPNVFYSRTVGKILTVAGAPSVALEDASLSTWIEPEDGTAFVYYAKGSLAGLLLDILIRDASDNRASLDDVMRDVYETTYKRGLGFTAEDWWAAVRDAAGGEAAIDLGAFADRYVDGREPYPWESVLPLGGLLLAADTTLVPRIGVITNVDEDGILVERVVPGGAAAAAGVRVGDYLVRLGDVQVRDDAFGADFRERYAGEPEDTPLGLVVRRNGNPTVLDLRLRFSEDVNLTIQEDPTAPPKAARIRQGILTGRVDR